MRRVHKVLFVFLTVQIFVLGVAGSLLSTYQLVASGAIGSKLIIGLMTAREAETQGASRERIADFSRTLNLVLDLIERAEEEKARGSVESAQALMSRAESMLERVIREAESEKSDAVNRAQQQKVIAIILVLVLSSVITFVAGRTSRCLRKRNLERLFRMEIQVREENEKETQRA